VTKQHRCLNGTRSMQYEVLIETALCSKEFCKRLTPDQSLINDCSEFSLSLSRSARREGLLSSRTLDMNAAVISKYNS
jgi:hypothetical protein